MFDFQNISFDEQGEVIIKQIKMKETFPRSYLNTTEINTKSLDLGFDPSHSFGQTPYFHFFLMMTTLILFIMAHY